MNAQPKRCFQFSSGFSLLEVVVAIGIFAAGVVTVVGLLGGLAKSIGANTETTVAANLGALLQAHLQLRAATAGSPEAIVALMPTPADGLPRVLYVSRDGTKIGESDDPVWADGANDKFYAITLRPVDGGEHALPLVVPYLAEVRWPALLRTGAAPASTRSQQQLSLVGAVSR